MSWLVGRLVGFVGISRAGLVGRLVRLISRLVNIFFDVSSPVAGKYIMQYKRLQKINVARCVQFDQHSSSSLNLYVGVETGHSRVLLSYG